MDELQRQIRDVQRIISSSPTSIIPRQVLAFRDTLKGLDSINSAVARIAAAHSAVLTQNPLSGITRAVEALSERRAMLEASAISSVLREQRSIEKAAAASAIVFDTIAPFRLANTSALAAVSEANRSLAAMIQGHAKASAIAEEAVANIASLLTPSTMELAAKSLAQQFATLQSSSLASYLTKAYESDVSSAWEDESLQAEQQEVLSAVAGSNFDTLSFGRQIEFLIRRSNEAEDVEKKVLFRELAFSLVVSAFVDYFQPKWASMIYLIVSTAFSYCVRRVSKGLDLKSTKDDVITNDCRMLDRPARKGKLIAKIPKYTTVLVQEKQKKWIHVAVVDSQAKIKVFGWVKSKYVYRA